VSDRHMEKLVERMAISLEKLAEDPVLQIESGPPVCPFCNTIAEVEIQEDSGEGPLAVYIIKPTCLHCHNPFFAIPLEWAIFTTHEEAQAEIEKRAEVFGVQNGG
jgi:hypothetical protein